MKSILLSILIVVLFTPMPGPGLAASGDDTERFLSSLDQTLHSSSCPIANVGKLKVEAYDVPLMREVLGNRMSPKLLTDSTQLVGRDYQFTKPSKTVLHIDWLLITYKDEDAAKRAFKCLPAHGYLKSKILTPYNLVLRNKTLVVSFTESAGDKEALATIAKSADFLDANVGAFITVPKRPVVKGAADAACKLQMTDENHFYIDAMTEHAASLVLCVDKWTPPCVLMSQELAEIQTEPQNKSIRFLFIRTAHNRDMTAMYKLHLFPTILIFKDGKLVKNQPGFVRKDNVEKLLGEVRS